MDAPQPEFPRRRPASSLLNLPGRREEYVLTRWLFLRALGLIYLVAFLSLSTQITGLVGRRGILPVEGFLAAASGALGSSAWQQLPTLLWLNHTDAFLRGLCVAGVILAGLVTADLLTLPALAGLWALYLSLFYAGQDFLGFQWDILLLETGFLAIFFAPLSWPGRRPGLPSLSVLWLLRLLVFRLMFGSGVAKLASGDPTWRDLSATAYHYQTQPLPTPLGWVMHHLPMTAHRAEVGFTFVAELIAPFLIFAPRPLRLGGAAVLVVLQFMILLTGNFAFFNWLSIVLCLTLLDDAALRRLWPARLRARLEGQGQREPSPGRRGAHLALFGVLLLFNLTQLARLAGAAASVPGPIEALEKRLAPLQLVNNYGLFASMTTQRPEIVLEGSREGQAWREYRFRYKPGNLRRAPMWVAPYQPRLDWQLWFAALQGSPAQTPWMGPFVWRLLQGEPQVLALLGPPPFPDGPPRFVRGRLYEYTYTTPSQRRATGQWWTRRLLGEYFSPVSLKDLQPPEQATPP
ncbi:lipase maturation factor family protein [Deinococcus navajonensis]|uniref:Lipase maturation factor family protein n=1 Tax=Deinococcus navajonensis TaxID=309884 RepID=A0ABV8XMP5_9DEIO